MTSSTYLSAAALDQLAEAQAVIDKHVACSRLGRCGLCQEVEPCVRRREAEQVFARYRRLPQRTPGLTFATASRDSSWRWFAEATPWRIAGVVERSS